ncbi:MAG TPA: phosphatase PAP2 family protein [Porticoccaceae bacterium]|nr:phosphatase PAP2 family protein [Porticoccaceae bacterium]
MDRDRFHVLTLLHYIHQGDVLTFNWCMRRKRRELFTTAGRLVSKTADGPWYVLPPLALWPLDALLAQQLLLVLALGFLVERPLYTLLKKGLRRNRPAQALPGFQSFVAPADQFSFPSGHTSGAFLVATATGGLVPELAPVLFPWAVLVGLSRVFLGVHFPTDIAAGAVMGGSLGLLVLETLG